MNVVLTCPTTRLPLRRVDLATAREAINDARALATRSNGRTPVGETATVLLRGDDQAAYPIVDGFPILLGPEVLTARPTTFDLEHGRYAESYLETAFYDAEAAAKAEEIRRGSLARSDSEVIRWLDGISRLPASARQDFPSPSALWLNDRMDLGANWDCYSHVGSMSGKRVLQIGGSGASVTGFMLAGASEGWLVTPMVGEARLAVAVAEAVGVHVDCVVGIGEEVPFDDATFDVVFSAGCIHHMTTELAFPEIARVLRPGGRFAAIEPWRAPLYAIGTRIFGKRERNAFCRPLTRERVAPLFDAFAHASIVQHGALTRYPMLAAEKLGARFSPSAAWRVGRVDDAICSLLGLRRFGSSIALLGTK